MINKIKNKGYTLVELIVVIAIVATLATGSGIALTSVSKASYKKAANSIYGMLNQCKINNMSGKPCELILDYDSTKSQYYSAIYGYNRTSGAYDIEYEKKYYDKRVYVYYEQSNINGCRTRIKFDEKTGTYEYIYRGSTNPETANKNIYIRSAPEKTTANEYRIRIWLFTGLYYLYKC